MDIQFEDPRKPIKRIFLDQDLENLFSAAKNLQKRINNGEISSNLNRYDSGKLITNNTNSNSGFQSPRR